MTDLPPIPLELKKGPSLVNDRVVALNNPQYKDADALIQTMCFIELVNSMRESTIFALEAERIEREKNDAPAPAYVNEQGKPITQAEHVQRHLLIKLENIGVRIGHNLLARTGLFKAAPLTPLEAVKFVCQDIWMSVFGKQIDSLKTDHKGVFVLYDAHFAPLSALSSPHGRQDAMDKSLAFISTPAGIIKGALHAMGHQVLVHYEFMSAHDALTFTLTLKR